MNWSEFIAQHDGLKLIKETYKLTDSDLIEAFTQGLNSLLQVKHIAGRYLDDK